MRRRRRVTIVLLATFVVVGPASGILAVAHADLDDRIAVVSRRIDGEPGNAALRLFRGELHRGRREFAAARDDYRAARRLDPDLAAVDLALGAMWLEAGRPRRAVPALDRFIARRPANVEARIARARALVRLGDRLEAVEEYSRAIALGDASNPPRPEYFLERARALAALGPGRLDDALRGLDEGLARLREPVALQLEAVALEVASKRWDAALARLDRIAERSERREHWRRRRAEILENAGRIDAARAAWDVAAAPSTLASASAGGRDPSVPRLGGDPGAALVRGPYLQLGTPEGLVVRWRTDRPTGSVVRFGSSPDALSQAVEDPSPVTDHAVALAGLRPETTYFYAIGTPDGLLAGGDDGHAFVTSPLPGTAKPTRVWVLGDSGTADHGAMAVRDAYARFTGDRRTDLWLMLGDNAYYDGTDAEYQAAVFEMYPEMLARAVLWPTLGNHDGHTAESATQSGRYYDIFTLPIAGEAGGLPSGTEAYYSFDYGNIHFICLESFETDRSAAGAMMTWLLADARSTARDWIVAFWHHPPYSRGSHDSDYEVELAEMRENALPILEEAGVDLVLTGHSHSYERSFLLDGHYGPSWTLAPEMKLDPGDGRENGDGVYRKTAPGPAPHRGAVYVVAGSSGWTGGGSLDHPAMVLSLDSLESLVLDFDGGRLDATALGADGSIDDRFTIVKGSPNRPPVAAVAAAVATECTSPAGAEVELDGSGSTDPDSTPGTSDDIASYDWFEDHGLPSETPLGHGARLTTTLPLGPHAVTLRVADRSGATDFHRVEVAVIDTTPPAIEIALAPRSLWPPDHRLETVVVQVTGRDACGAVETVLSSVSSSEPDDAPGAADGRTSGDIRGADVGAPDLELELRAERAGGGPGRIYTIVYTATDATGHPTRGVAVVTVPHDAGR